MHRWPEIQSMEDSIREEEAPWKTDPLEEKKPVLNAKQPHGSLQQNTKFPSHSGWPFRLKPFNPSKTC